jgi:hypothetical protein
MSTFKQAAQVYWKINWLRRIIKVAVTTLLILAILPIVLQMLVTHQLKKMGAHEASIEDIDLNLFAGSLQVKQLSFSRGDERPAKLADLALDIDMLKLFSREISIQYVRISGFDFDITRHKSGDISVNGLTVVNIEKPEPPATNDETTAQGEPLHFAVHDLLVRESLLTYRETDLLQRLDIPRLAITGIDSKRTDKAALVESTLVLNDARLKLDAEALLFAETRRIKGKLGVAKVKVQDYAKFYREHIDGLQAMIDLEADFDVSLGDVTLAKLDSKIDISDVNATYRQLTQSLKGLSWQGSTRLGADGKIDVTGELSMLNNRTRDQEQGYDLLTFDKLQLGGLHYTSETIAVASLALENLAVIKDAPIQPDAHKRFAAITKIDLSQLTFRPGDPSLLIEQLGLSAPQASILLDKQRQLLHLAPLMKTVDRFTPQDKEASASSTADSPTSQSPPLAITIKQLNLRDPGRVDIEDAGVSPTFKTSLALNRIDVTNISNSDAATLDIELKLGDYTAVGVSGQGLIFDPLQSMQLDVKVTQLDLPPVTPYTSGAMGYGMKSGTVDSELKVKLDQHNIDSLVELKIDSIEIVETQAETAQQISSASGMSIDLAVSSLKDSDNVIALKIPVKGNIDQPDFDLSHVINAAMGKAMKSATLTYLKHTLQPFGSLITLFDLAKAAADYIALPPVVFQVNSTQFAEQQTELLEKVVKVLQERPGLKIKACGIANEEDRKAIEAELIEAEKVRLAKEAASKPLPKDSAKPDAAPQPMAIEIAAETISHKAGELADKRSARVKQLILEQGKLEPNRILNCLSAVKSDKDAQPSVELSI